MKPAECRVLLYMYMYVYIYMYMCKYIGETGTTVFDRCCLESELSHDPSSFHSTEILTETQVAMTTRASKRPRCHANSIVVSPQMYCTSS